MSPRFFIDDTGTVRLCESKVIKRIHNIHELGNGQTSEAVWHRCFPVNFAKCLRTLFSIEHLTWLLLQLLPMSSSHRITFFILRARSNEVELINSKNCSELRENLFWRNVLSHVKIWRKDFINWFFCSCGASFFLLKVKDSLIPLKHGKKLKWWWFVKSVVWFTCTSVWQGCK